jgi:hypothetical protein
VVKIDIQKNIISLALILNNYNTNVCFHDLLNFVRDSINKLCQLNTPPIQMTAEEIASFHRKFVPRRSVKLYALYEFAEKFLTPHLPTPISVFYNSAFIKKTTE